MAELEHILQYLEAYLELSDHPDSSTALNGLQVQGPAEVEHLVVAVDASEASIRSAVERGADLLLVHHGLFWGGLTPLTGQLFRRVAPLIRSDVGLCSIHLPLDAHRDVGNCALLAEALGLEVQESFADYDGVDIGWWGRLAEGVPAHELEGDLREVLGGPVHTIAGGPAKVRRVGVVTGAGAGFLSEAVELGLDALVTGEAPHHAHFDAMESGIHLFLGGHYATETFGVKALAAHLADRFDLTWEFLDQPTGL